MVIFRYNIELYHLFIFLFLYVFFSVYNLGGGQHGPRAIVHQQGRAPQDAGERRAV